MASVKGVNAWPNADGKQMLSHMSHSLVQQFACKLTTLAVYKKFLSRLLLSIVTEVLSLCSSGQLKKEKLWGMYRQKKASKKIKN